MNVAEWFREESDKWDKETSHLSSPTQMALHPSYQAILKFAVENPVRNQIIQLMLQDLKENRRHWFGALYQLTNENPIKKKDAGYMDKMIKAWVQWGREKGFSV